MNVEAPTLVRNSRMSRAQFWTAVTPLPIIGLFAVQLDFRLQTGRWHIGPSPVLLFYWSLICVCIVIYVFALRAHDRNKSAWWVLLYLVPWIGWLWALIELGFF